MGRPRKNVNAKIIQGTFRPDRELKPDFCPPLEKMPPAPPWLGKAGQELWDKLGKQLVSSGVITNIDLTAFLMLAETADSVEAIKALMTNNGKETLAKGVKDDPALFRAYKYHLDFKKKLLTEFGVTPASHNRVQPSPSRQEDEDT
ncbi:MAG: P27 family phage terminase small subunit, partial [Treponema sp.]|nr:P27 family phage terminase small subunit [Treponema sp.]